jgi:hypothetical protein
VEFVGYGVAAGVGRRVDLPLDVALAIIDADGKELARNDDLPGATDAALEFTAPADGVYQLCVSDASAASGNRAAVYRLIIQPATPGFSLSALAMVAAPIGGKASLALKATRRGGFNDPIAIAISGLPAGVAAPAERRLRDVARIMDVAAASWDDTRERPVLPEVPSGCTFVQLKGSR